jgi:hypothetical protein
MPHEPRPFYKAARRTWYVELDRTQHSLGKHPDGLPEPRKGKDGRWNAPAEVLQELRRVMAAAGGAPPASAPAPEHPLVAVVLDRYLD